MNLLRPESVTAYNKRYKKCIYSIFKLSDSWNGMQQIRIQLAELFAELNDKVEALNQERGGQGLFPIGRAKVQILGQMSLLSHGRASLFLSLAQTGDLDAFLLMDNVVKEELKLCLMKRGLVYDEDSYLIWIPPGSKFETLFEMRHVTVECLDPESTLVSKAVKAPEKNKQLIREAIASGEFDTLVDRIIENGGKLENFI